MLDKMRSINYSKNFRVCAIISAVLILAGLVGVILLPFGVQLFNFDIDFAGGTTMQYALHTQMNEAEFEKISGIVEGVIGEPPSSLQRSGDGTEIIIKVPDISTELREQITAGLTEAYSITEDDILLIDNVSPAVGRELQRTALLSALAAAILMLVYITIRFEFRSGLAAVCCLIHDLLIMLSAYVIFGIPFNMNFIAAALTILGYSINASIIIFDRIRENDRNASRRDSFADTVNKSIGQTLGRSLNTTLTTLFPIVLIYILGVASLQNFALPIIIGILFGTYSSIFLAGPLWVRFRRKAS